MKKVKNIKSDGFYIFQGRSNANSCFIEKLSHGELFLTYANYYLQDYLEVYDYLIDQNGWMLAVKIKTKEHLLKISNKLDGETWRIVSERIRLFLGTFVKVSNSRKGRTGCLVHNSYERLYFESKAEAMGILDKMRNQRIKMYNGRKKYRGIKTHYRVEKSVGRGSIFLCSRDVRKRNLGELKFGEMLSVKELNDLVVQKMVNSSLPPPNQRTTTKKPFINQSKNQNSS